MSHSGGAPSHATFGGVMPTVARGLHMLGCKDQQTLMIMRHSPQYTQCATLVGSQVSHSDNASSLLTLIGNSVAEAGQ